MINTNNSKIIGVIGPSEFHCTKEIYDFGCSLGKLIVDSGCFLVCGGLGGIMEAVCKGAYQSDKYIHGKTIGIIPSSDKTTANKYCDIVVATGIGFARNMLVVNTADLVIAVSGGSGTLSEISFAWQMNRPIVCYDGFGGWASELADRKLDNRREKAIIRASSLSDLEQEIKKILISVCLKSK